MSKDIIYRQDAINALWKALYEYEDKTKRQFQESEDLDIEDWIEHRNFVQNMNDIDRQTILNLPPAQLDGIPHNERLPEKSEEYDPDSWPVISMICFIILIIGFAISEIF